MTPDELRAKLGKATKGEESFEEAVARVKTEAPKPQVQARPALRPAAPKVEAAQPMAAPPARGTGQLPIPRPDTRPGEVIEPPAATSYGEALGVLGNMAADKVGEIATQPWLAAGAVAPGAALPLSLVQRARNPEVERRIREMLRPVRDAVPTPDEVLETGKRYLGGG